MFSERWICFCCPQTLKPRRSILPIDEMERRPPLRRKKSDISKILYIELDRECLFFFSQALSSVLIIQSWFRRRQALLEMRRKAAWTIYQNIEYSGEQDQLKVNIDTIRRTEDFILFSIALQFLFGINASSE